MRNIAVLFALVVVLSSTATAQKGSRYAPGELLVKFRAGTSQLSEHSAHNTVRGELIKRFDGLGWSLIRIADVRSVETAINTYLSSPHVEAAQPNFYYQLMNTPNDPDFAGMYGLSKISAPAAWMMSTGSPDVVVAVIDSGARLTHEDLARQHLDESGRDPE